MTKRIRIEWELLTFLFSCNDSQFENWNWQPNQKPEAIKELSQLSHDDFLEKVKINIIGIIFYNFANRLRRF